MLACLEAIAQDLKSPTAQMFDGWMVDPTHLRTPVLLICGRKGLKSTLLTKLKTQRKHHLAMRIGISWILYTWLGCWSLFHCDRNGCPMVDRCWSIGGSGLWSAIYSPLVNQKAHSTRISWENACTCKCRLAIFGLVRLWSTVRVRTWHYRFITVSQHNFTSHRVYLLVLIIGHVFAIESREGVQK